MNKNLYNTILKIILGIILLPFILFGLFLVYYGYIMNPLITWQVQRGFHSIPGVKIIDYHLDDDGFSYVKINVKDKGDMRIGAFLPEYFKKPEHIFIKSIGPCAFNIYEYGDHTYGRTIYATNPGTVVRENKPPQFRHWTDINIGTKGEFAKLLGREITSVADIVENYDKILATVEKWPNSNNPEYQDLDSTESIMHVKDKPNMTTIGIYDSNFTFKQFYTSTCGRSL